MNTLNRNNKWLQIDLNLKEDIITKRNVRMAKRIDQMINDYPQRVIFTAIGTGIPHGPLSKSRFRAFPGRAKHPPTSVPAGI